MGQSGCVFGCGLVMHHASRVTRRKGRIFFNLRKFCTFAF